MNNKISIQELSLAISDITGYDVKACDLFLRELFATITETIVTGENVKVRGIGTFKCTTVEQRKSVNVNTGEQMIIPGHRKVSFTPDKALAEAVNAPFAMFEPVELNDDVTEAMLDSADKQPSETHINTANQESHVAPESSHNNTDVSDDATVNSELQEQVRDDSSHDNVNTLSTDTSTVTIDHSAEQATGTQTGNTDVTTQDQNDDSAQSHSISSTSNSESESESDSKQENTEDTTNGASEEISNGEIDNLTYCETSPLPSQDSETDDIVLNIGSFDNDIKETIEEEDSYNYEDLEQRRKYRSHFGKGFILGMISIIVLLVIFFFGWLLLMPDSYNKIRNAFSDTANLENAVTAPIVAQTSGNTDNSTTNLITSNDTNHTDGINPVVVTEEISVPTSSSDTIHTTTVKSATPKTDSDKDSSPTVYNDKITKKRYLTTMAREYYGNYSLWPLIYDYNAGLGHPDRIRPGNKIKVPSPEILGVDIKDPNVIKQAKKRGTEIYAQYK